MPMHTLEGHQAAATLKAALIGFYLACQTKEFAPTALSVTLTLDEHEDPEASYEVYHGNHPMMGGSL